MFGSPAIELQISMLRQHQKKKSFPKPKRVCESKNDHMLSYIGESFCACVLLVSVSVCGTWVCWTRQEAVQVRISIFINFKVFRTPHPYSLNNTVPQLHSVFIFPTSIWQVWRSRYQRETIQSYPNGNSTIKTRLQQSAFTAPRQTANPNSCALISN